MTSLPVLTCCPGRGLEGLLDSHSPQHWLIINCFAQQTPWFSRPKAVMSLSEEDTLTGRSRKPLRCRLTDGPCLLGRPRSYWRNEISTGEPTELLFKL